jgi:hypothetical protein
MIEHEGLGTADGERRSNGTDGKRDALRYVAAVTDFLKAAAWPLIVLLAYVEFRGPLHQAVAVLPQKLSESQKVSVGSLSFEIERRATAIGDPELGSLIGGLSSSAIELMLRINRNQSSSMISYSDHTGQRTYHLPKEDEFIALAELERNRLLDAGVPLAEYRSFVSAALRRTGDADTREDYVARRSLSDAEEKRLWQAQYRLSDRGIRAVQLIVDAVTRELARAAD